MALNPSILNKYDPSGMHKIYDRWPELARESYESKIDAIDYRFIDHIVFAGMGGSGAISDIFASILSKTDVHVSVNKGKLGIFNVGNEDRVDVISIAKIVCKNMK